MTLSLWCIWLCCIYIYWYGWIEDCNVTPVTCKVVVLFLFFFGEREREMGFEIERVVESESGSLPLLSLNHVSFVCKSVIESVRFYEEVLGFVMIKRPSSFNFEGAWWVLCSFIVVSLDSLDGEEIRWRTLS